MGDATEPNIDEINDAKQDWAEVYDGTKEREEQKAKGDAKEMFKKWWVVVATIGGGLILGASIIMGVFSIITLIFFLRELGHWWIAWPFLMGPVVVLAGICFAAGYHGVMVWKRPRGVVVTVVLSVIVAIALFRDAEQWYGPLSTLDGDFVINVALRAPITFLVNAGVVCSVLGAIGYIAEHVQKKSQDEVSLKVSHSTRRIQMIVGSIVIVGAVTAIVFRLFLFIQDRSLSGMVCEGVNYSARIEFDGNTYTKRTGNSHPQRGTYSVSGATVRFSWTEAIRDGDYLIWKYYDWDYGMREMKFRCTRP